MLIINSTTVELESEGALTRAIQRKRRTLFPRDPATANDLLLQGEWVRTFGDDPWLLSDLRVNEDRVLIFTTEANIRILAVKIIYQY